MFPLRNYFIFFAAPLAIAGCGGDGSSPLVTVPAAGETTAVATASDQDAADDAAIWASGVPVSIAGQLSPGFILGTDKKAGLYVYGFDGKVLQFLPDGRLNNVDLIDSIDIAGRRHVLIGASDRGAERMGMSLYLFDPAATEPGNALRPWTVFRSDVVEPYGFCLGRHEGSVHAILTSKDGALRQYRVAAAADGAPEIAEVRRLALGSISEGCVVDEAADALYVNEESKGIWRYGLAPASGDTRTHVAPVDGKVLTADVEGAALLRDGEARYLIVSSQGDSSFAVWRVDGAAPVFAGRFAVADAGGVDGVSGTDGVAALGGPVGPFPEGLVVVQDDVNDNGPQNFKLIDWREIRNALKLK